MIDILHLPFLLTLTLTFCRHLRSHLPSPFFTDTYVLPTLTFSYVFVLKNRPKFQRQNMVTLQSEE